MAIIRAEHLSKYYGSEEALVKSVEDVSVSFERGAITSIIGKSGSGKTTLLHMLGGLELPTNGKVFIDGKSLYDLKDGDRTAFRSEKLGFIFQKFNLFPDMTVIDNIRFPLRLSKRKIDDKRGDDLLEMLDLIDRKKFYPHQLSGGGQQRVAIARALLMQPEIILADEPTGNIDNDASTQLLTFIKESNARFGQTYVIVTHDTYVAKFADIRIRMQDGRIAGDE